MIFPKIITTTSSVAHLTITVKMLHLYILTAFISVVRHGTALNNSIITSDNRVGSSSGVGSPSHNHVEALQVQAIPQNYTTDLVLMVSRNISTPVTPGIPTPPRACGSNGRGVLHLVLTVWECYKPYACCGGAGLVLVVLIIIIVVIVKRCRKRAPRAMRMRKLDPLSISRIIPDEQDPDEENNRYVDSPVNPAKTPEASMIPCYCKPNDRAVCDPRYANTRDVTLINSGHGTRSVPRHSCPLKRPINKDSLYEDVTPQERMLDGESDDDEYVPPQSWTSQHGATGEGARPTQMGHIDVPSPLGPVSAQDIHSVRGGRVTGLNNSTSDMNSGYIQVVQGDFDTGNSSGANNTVDISLTTDDDIYVNTSISSVENPYLNSGSQGSGTSSPVNDASFQACVNPGYCTTAVQKRSWDTQGRSNSEYNQTAPVNNTNSIYDDAVSVKDNAMYVNVEYSPSNPNRGEVFDGEVFEDTYAVASNMMSISIQDIHSFRDGKRFGFNHSTHDINSRSVPDITGGPYKDDNANIYMNTSTALTDNLLRDNCRQGLGASSHANQSRFQTHIRPGYKVPIVHKRSREINGYPNSECSQKIPINNTCCNYNEVMSDESATDNTVYANVEYAPSNSDHVNSEVLHHDIYDDTYAVADSTMSSSAFRDDKGPSFNNFPYGINSRRKQEFQANTSTADMSTAADDDIYANTSTGTSDNPLRDSCRQRSGTSSHVDHTLLETPAKPEDNVPDVHKRSRDEHGCPISERNQKIGNTSSIYDDVKSERAPAVDTVYANVKYTPSKSDHGNSGVLNDELYDDNYAVTDSTISISAFRDDKGSGFNNFTYGINSRRAQDIRANSYRDNSSGVSNTDDDTATAADDDIYVNTATGPTDEQLRDNCRQGSGTSSHVGHTHFQTPAKPGYNAPFVQKRSRDTHGCPNSECSRKQTSGNTSSIYDDVIIDETPKDDTLYINVEYPPSKSDLGNSEVFDCELYDDTYAVTDSTIPPPQRYRAPSDEEVYGGVYMKQEHLDTGRYHLIEA